MSQTLKHNEALIQVTPVDIPRFDGDTQVIQKLDDEPNDVGGLSAQELKEKFDAAGTSIAEYINDTLIPRVVADDATEQARQAAEAERVANEIERVANENARVTAESGRVEAEAARVTAETTRQQNEDQRIENEAAREDLETGYVAQAQQAAETAEYWAKQAEEVVGGEYATHTEVSRAVSDEASARQSADTALGGRIDSVEQALQNLGVTSFNGRTGSVVPRSGDYTAAMVGAEAQIKGGSVTLLAANWTGSGPWTQAVTIAGTTANSKVDHSLAGDDYDALAAAGVMFLQLKQENGSVTAEVRGAKPTFDLTLQVTVTEVIA